MTVRGDDEIGRELQPQDERPLLCRISEQHGRLRARRYGTYRTLPVAPMS